MPLTDNLVAYWSLEESSGSRADATGRGNTLSDNNTVTSGTGKIATGAQFTAANSEYLSLSDNADVSMGDFDFSFAAWVKLDSNSATMIIVGKDVDTPGGSRDYALLYSTGGGGFQLYLDGGNQSVIWSISPNTGQFYYVAGGHNATDNVVWISVDGGTPQTSATGGTAPPDSGAQFRLGARAFAGFESYWDGMIDEVGVWKRDIRSDLSSLYNGGAGLSYAAMSGGGSGDLSVKAHEPVVGSSLFM